MLGKSDNYFKSYLAATVSVTVDTSGNFLYFKFYPTIVLISLFSKAYFIGLLHVETIQKTKFLFRCLMCLSFSLRPNFRSVFCSQIKKQKNEECNWPSLLIHEYFRSS